MTLNVCPECYPSQKDVVFWKDLDVNPALKEMIHFYISPVKQWHPSFELAAAEWGIILYPQYEEDSTC